MLITLTKADLLNAASNSTYCLGHFAVGGLVAFAVQQAASKIFNLRADTGLEASYTDPYGATWSIDNDHYKRFAITVVSFAAGACASYALMPLTPMNFVAFTARKAFECIVINAGIHTLFTQRITQFILDKTHLSKQTQTFLCPILSSLPLILFSAGMWQGWYFSYRMPGVPFSKICVGAGVSGAAVGASLLLVQDNLKKLWSQMQQRLNPNPAPAQI